LAAIIRDTSPWKIAVIHHPPYSSGEDTFPGESVVRWVTDLPVHAVVSAHANVYERLTVRNRPHFIVGTGGMELDGFNSTPYPGSITRISDFGYLKLTATCNDARFEFIDKDGEVRDTLILDRAVPVTPSSPLMDPVITDHPDSAVVNFGDDYQLSVTASGTEPLFYQWQLDGVDIEGANSSTYTANDIEEVRRYRVRVWNHVGAVVSAEALVLPFIQPTAQYIAIPGWGALKERTLHSPNEVVTLSFVDAKDDYGAGRKYIFDPNAMADEDKPNVAIPNDIDPSHPGRW